MAKFDLITLLTLNAGGFNDGLNKAKKSSQDFGKGIQTISSGVKTAFTGMLSAVGIGMTVFESVKKTIEATQLTSDKFEKSMAQGKGAVDYFFISLSSGDFSEFIKGLKESISAAGELAEVLDNLEDVRRGIDITKAKNQLKLTDLEIIYKDKTGKYSNDERKQAYEKAKTIMQKEATDDYQTFVTESNAMLKELAAKTGLTVDKIKDIIENYQGNYENMFAEITKKYKGLGDATINKKEYLKLIPEQDQAAAKIWLNFQKASADKLNAVGEALINQYTKENEIKNVNLKLIRVYNELFEIQKDGNNSVNDDLKDKLYILQQIENAETENLWQKQLGLNVDAQNMGANAPTSISGKIENKLPELSFNKNSDNVISNNDSMIVSYNELGNAISNVSSAFMQMFEDGKVTGGEFASLMGQIFGQIVATIGQAAIETLTAKKAETLGVVAMEGTQSEAAITKKSIQKGGWAGIALAAIGIAAVGALFAGIQNKMGKYAAGGMIPGMGSQDNVPVWTTPGEIILNKMQQRNIVSHMQNGSNVNVTGELNISADQLKILLKNSDLKNNRYM